jgi:hypothetical protein
MDEPETLRQLATALEDVVMHLNLLALLPFTVHVDHRLERQEFERRASRERAARLLSRIPMPRPPSEAPGRVPAGSPATPNTRWGTRSTR